MSLSALVSLNRYITAGGPGSGCQGPNCGRPKSGLAKLLEQAKANWGSNNLWSKLAEYGHDGQVGKFSKEETAALKQLEGQVGNCRIGQCFMNAQRLALAGLHDRRVQYVEGLVTVHGVPIDHAWIEFNGKVYDPTLKPKGWEPEYFGVTVPKDEIVRHQFETKMYAPLSHSAGDEKLQAKIWRK